MLQQPRPRSPNTKHAKPTFVLVPPHITSEQIPVPLERLAPVHDAGVVHKDSCSLVEDPAVREVSTAGDEAGQDGHMVVVVWN
eukprot:CAMPEP_0119128676 /NCGR_PEP_ID=MMETSP1310-20130426/6735_1 /TAXON_ID=464262 /ORGANISM="Genus nov. species nov., Strain RCC2339" /LENGTH=82 /DNA_ID=CAMNT_0007119039 /DNA_START=443 /DNA_END=691 /DNA_ORIENTATION=+